MSIDFWSIVRGCAFGDRAGVPRAIVNMNAEVLFSHYASPWEMWKRQEELNDLTQLMQEEGCYDDDFDVMDPFETLEQIARRRGAKPLQRLPHVFDYTPPSQMRIASVISPDKGIGSTFDPFLEEEGIKEEVEQTARRRVLEENGWSVGNAEDFLEMSPEEDAACNDWGVSAASRVRDNRTGRAECQLRSCSVGVSVMCGLIRKALNKWAEWRQLKGLDEMTRLMQEAGFYGKPDVLVLSPEAYDALVEDINNPPEPSEALRKLMNTPAPWEKGNE